MSQIDELVKQFNKTHKETIAIRGVERGYISRIPFSSPLANYMLYGGIPRGRVVEFCGEESSGKTTTALDVVAQAQMLFATEHEARIAELEEEVQKKLSTSVLRDRNSELAYLKERGPLTVLYVDSENTLDCEWAEKLGVDTESLYLLRPNSQSAEELFEMILDIVKTRECGLVVLDSIGTLLSKQAMEKSVEEKTYCGIAGPLTVFSNKLSPLLNSTNCTFIGINQVRDDMNNPYNTYSTPGGRSWKHHCSVRIMFQKGSFIDEKVGELKRSASAPAGNIVLMNLIKTKVCKPDRRVGSYTLNYASGIDFVYDTVETALKYGIINGSGWYTIVGADGQEIQKDGAIVKIQGKPNVIDFLNDNPDIFEQIYSEVSRRVSMGQGL